MVLLFHAVPFRKLTSQPVVIDAANNVSGGNVIEGLDSVFYFDEPGDCALDIACSVAIPQEQADRFDVIRTTVSANDHNVGQTEIPFRSDRYSYQFGDLRIYQWKQEVSFNLDAAAIITCQFEFCDSSVVESADGVLRILILFGPNPAIDR